MADIEQERTIEMAEDARRQKKSDSSDSERERQRAFLRQLRDRKPATGEPNSAWNASNPNSDVATNDEKFALAFGGAIHGLIAGAIGGAIGGITGGVIAGVIFGLLFGSDFILHFKVIEGMIGGWMGRIIVLVTSGMIIGASLTLIVSTYSGGEGAIIRMLSTGFFGSIIGGTVAVYIEKIIKALFGAIIGIIFGLIFVMYAFQTSEIGNEEILFGVSLGVLFGGAFAPVKNFSLKVFMGAIFGGIIGESELRVIYGGIRSIETVGGPTSGAIAGVIFGILTIVTVEWAWRWMVDSLKTSRWIDGS